MKLLLTALVVICSINLLGCNSSDPNEEKSSMVFVDTKTMAAVIQPVTDSFPAINPETGARTLMPGLYCTSCKTWYPIPPPDQINRRPDAALCPKTKKPLTSDGPWPEEGQSTAGEKQ